MEKEGNKHLKIILALIVIAIVALTPVLIHAIRQYKEKQKEYSYAYGEEPNDGPVSYSKDKSNIINPKTKEVIVEDIEWCHYSDNKDEDPIVLFAKKGKRGFCNIVTNEIIVPATTYTKAWEFSEGLAAVEKDGYIGFVNTKGKVAIKFKYSYRGNRLTEFVFHHGHCIVADSSNKIGVIDHKGRWVIKPLYDDIHLAKDYAIVYKDGEFKKQIDFNGNVVQDGIIDYINNIYYEETYTDLQMLLRFDQQQGRDHHPAHLHQHHRHLPHPVQGAAAGLELYRNHRPERKSDFQSFVTEGTPEERQKNASLQGFYGIIPNKMYFCATFFRVCPNT